MTEQPVLKADEQTTTRDPRAVEIYDKAGISVADVEQYLEALNKFSDASEEFVKTMEEIGARCPEYKMAFYAFATAGAEHSNNEAVLRSGNFERRYSVNQGGHLYQFTKHIPASSSLATILGAFMDRVQGGEDEAQQEKTVEREPAPVG